jgi:hypothetical protein
VDDWITGDPAAKSGEQEARTGGFAPGQEQRNRADMSLFLCELRREKIWNYVLAMFTKDDLICISGGRITSVDELLSRLLSLSYAGAIRILRVAPIVQG